MQQSAEVVNRYFASWKQHDVELVRSLFHENASYIIHPRRRTFYGLGEIALYWARNAHRQKDLSLEWYITSNTDRQITADFIATFFDTEEQEHQIVEGAIQFHVDHDSKILNLAERYRKTVRDFTNCEG